MIFSRAEKNTNKDTHGLDGDTPLCCALVRQAFKRDAIKNTAQPYSRKREISQVSKANVFTSDLKKRLHPPSLKLWRDKQGFFGYLVKLSRLHYITPRQGTKTAFLSEELLLA